MPVKNRRGKFSIIAYFKYKLTSWSLPLNRDASITSKTQKKSSPIIKAGTSRTLNDPTPPHGPSSTITDIIFRKKIKNKKRKIIPFMGWPFHI
jgi:hypothetical protein